MKVQMSKTKRTLCLISLMLTNLAVMHDLVINPIISNLYGEFADNMGAVNYIVSGPALIVVFTSLLAGYLCKKMDKKIVLIVGALFFAVGAIFGVVVVNPYYMVAMRTLVGIGAGFEQMVAVSMIADVYEDENERAKMTGYFNATMSFVGIIYSYVAGILANNGIWQDAFKCYWIAIPMIVFLFLFVPSVKPDKEQKVEQGQKKATEALGFRFWVLEISWFIANVLFGSSILYYVSMYIAENELGDVAFAGIATSVKQVVGFILCLFFGVIYGALKRHTITVSYFIAALSLAIMVISPSKFSAVVIATICGCCYKIIFSYMYAHGFSLVPSSRIDDSVAITTAVYGIGSFASTYFATWIMNIMHTERVTETWMVVAILFAVLGIVEIIMTLTEKKTA